MFCVSVLATTTTTPFEKIIGILQEDINTVLQDVQTYQPVDIVIFNMEINFEYRQDTVSYVICFFNLLLFFTCFFF